MILWSSIIPPSQWRARKETRKSELKPSPFSFSLEAWHLQHQLSYHHLSQDTERYITHLSLWSSKSTESRPTLPKKVIERNHVPYGWIILTFTFGNSEKNRYVDEVYFLLVLMNQPTNTINFKIFIGSLKSKILNPLPSFFMNWISGQEEEQMPVMMKAFVVTVGFCFHSHPGQC